MNQPAWLLARSRAALGRDEDDAGVERPKPGLASRILLGVVLVALALGMVLVVLALKALF